MEYYNEDLGDIIFSKNYNAKRREKKARRAEEAAKRKEAFHKENKESWEKVKAEADEEGGMSRVAKRMMDNSIKETEKKALKARYPKALDFIPDLTMFGFMNTSDESFSFYDYLNSLSDNDLDNMLGYISNLITEVENGDSDYYLNIEHITKDEFKVLKQAYEDVEHQTFQAMEGFVANLNTLHSRAGGQVK